MRAETLAHDSAGVDLYDTPEYVGPAVEQLGGFVETHLPVC